MISNIVSYCETSSTTNYPILKGQSGVCLHSQLPQGAPNLSPAEGVTLKNLIQRHYAMGGDASIEFKNTGCLRQGTDSRYNIHACASYHGKSRYDWVSIKKPTSGEICYGQVLSIFSIVTDDWVFIRLYKELSVTELDLELQRPAIIEMQSLCPFLSSNLNQTNLFILPICSVIKCEMVTCVGDMVPTFLF